MSNTFDDIEKQFPLNAEVDVCIPDSYSSDVHVFSGVVTAIVSYHNGFKIVIESPDKDEPVAIDSEYVTLNKKYLREEKLKDLMD